MEWFRRKLSSKEGKASSLHIEQMMFEILVVHCLRLPN